jgi:hypothetical protein
MPNVTPHLDAAALASALQAARDTHNEQALYQAIVNTPFKHRKETVKMGLGITVLLKVNKAEGTIDRIALSDTELAKGTTDMSAKPFAEIRIPLDDAQNSIAAALRTGKLQVVSDWEFLFTPVLTPQQARLNQAGGGIGCSVVYPFLDAWGAGAMIFSFFKYASSLTPADHAFMKQYCELVAKMLDF